jgi:hypothetical protein
LIDSVKTPCVRTCLHDSNLMNGKATPSDLGPLGDVFFGGPNWDVGRSEIALVEGADLVGLKGTDDGMQDSAVVEEYKILLSPIVGVHELSDATRNLSESSRGYTGGRRARCLPRAQSRAAASCREARGLGRDP